MKIFLAIFSTAVFIASNSYATGVFVGADSLYVSSRHQAKNPFPSSGILDQDTVTKDKMNYGINAGARLDVLNLLASAEVFYDRLGTSSEYFGFVGAELQNVGNFELRDRYGVKANFGFAILPRITPFITYGLANVRYDSTITVAKTKTTPIYGVGLLIDLPLGFSLKAAYDYQSFSTAYAQGKARTHLSVARLGVVYNF